MTNKQLQARVALLGFVEDSLSGDSDDWIYDLWVAGDIVGWVRYFSVPGRYLVNRGGKGSVTSSCAEEAYQHAVELLEGYNDK